MGSRIARSVRERISQPPCRIDTPAVFGTASDHLATRNFDGPRVLSGIIKETPPARPVVVSSLATGIEPRALPNATGLPGGSLRSSLQGTTPKHRRMPPACPVDRYVPRYRRHTRSCLECHRLARWIVTFLATEDRAANLPGMPPACPVDRYVPRYTGQHRSCLECHRLARWIVTFLATQDSIEAACECHRLARWIVTFLATQDSIEAALNATGLPGGSLRSSLHRTASKRP